MFLPDKRHIHHQLLASGFSQKTTVLLLYSVSSVFGAFAVLVSAGSLNGSLIIISLGILLIIISKKLGYRELAVFRNGILLRLYSLTILKHSILEICIDTISIIASIVFAYLLTHTGTQFVLIKLHLSDIILIISITALQLIVFYVGGLYKRKIVLLGLGDFLQILKVVFAAVLISYPILYFTSFFQSVLGLNVFVMLEFYLLLSMIAGSRLLFHTLNYLFKREFSSGKKILIYGANWKGMVAMQTLLQSDNKKIPVGFLDDDPELEGKYMNGYPIFGGHWKLESLLKKGIFDEILMTREKTDFEIFKRVSRITSRYNVPVYLSKINFVTIKNGKSKNKYRNIDIEENESLTPNAV